MPLLYRVPTCSLATHVVVIDEVDMDHLGIGDETVTLLRDRASWSAS